MLYFFCNTKGLPGDATPSSQEYEDAAGAGKDAPARDGGPGVSWARASGGDFTTARVNASTRRIRKLSPVLARAPTRHAIVRRGVFWVIEYDGPAVIDALVGAVAALTKETNGSRATEIILDTENTRIVGRCCRHSCPGNRASPSSHNLPRASRCHLGPTKQM